jgi:DNA-binding XRE family transcriptional regulator
MKKSILARNIKKLRMFKSLNQTEFGALFDLNRPTIGSYEEGRSEPRLQTLLKIARHYKLTVDDLVSKELTVNQVAGFDGPSSKKPGQTGIEQRLDDLERKIASLDASVRLVLKQKA